MSTGHLKSPPACFYKEFTGEQTVPLARDVPLVGWAKTGEANNFCHNHYSLRGVISNAYIISL
jgi:hypothetical protein